jgi:hypothetical protein
LALARRATPMLSPIKASPARSCSSAGTIISTLSPPHLVCAGSRHPPKQSQDDCLRVRLSHKGLGWFGVACFLVRRRVVETPGPSGGTGGEVLVELEEVVGGRKEPPFGPNRGSATSGKVGESAVLLGMAEDRLDQLCAPLVERLATLG